jgi:ubiquinone/menaquinone biosynthesis C-methylase UbiE
MKDIDYISYLKECVIDNTTPASFERTKDAQLKYIIQQISSFGAKTILDYGCGNCRVYNALCENKLVFDKYVGIDINKPIINESYYSKSNFSFFYTKDALSLPSDFFDYVIVCNVFHEIQILDMLYIIETSRQLLKSGGHLMILDMSILPKGELEAVPLIYEDFSDQNIPCDNYSFESHGGYPILALSIQKEDILDYLELEEKIVHLFTSKQIGYSRFAIMFCKGVAENSEKILKKLGLNSATGKSNLLGYLTYQSGLSTVKLTEYSISSKQPHGFVTSDGKFDKDYLDSIVYNDIITELIILSEVYCQGYGRYITIKEVFSELSRKYDLQDIKLAIIHAVAPCDYFFPLTNENRLLKQVDETVTPYLTRNPRVEDEIESRINKIPDEEKRPNRLILTW